MEPRLKTEILFLENGCLLEQSQDEYDFEKMNDENTYVVQMMCSARHLAVDQLINFGFPGEVCNMLLEPLDHLRFNYIGDLLYGEVAYYSLQSKQPYYAGIISYKNSLIIVFEEQLGLETGLLDSVRAMSKSSDQKLNIENALYTLVLELLSYNADIVLKFREEIEKIGQGVNNKTKQIFPHQLLEAKNHLSNYMLVTDQLFFTLSFPPARELLNLEGPYRIYFSDLSKTIRLLRSSLSQIEDKLNGLTDHLDLLQQEKSNKRLKYLTIIQAVFVPLTLISGIYGMNFAVMPELNWAKGYYAVLSAMAIVAFLVLMYFYKNKWFE